MAAHPCGLVAVVGLLAGLVFGGVVGALTLAACVAAKIDDERTERDERSAHNAGYARRAP